MPRRPKFTLTFAPEAIEYVKRVRYPRGVEEELGAVHAEDGAALFARADVLVSLLPISPETTHYFGSEAFAMIRN